MADQSFWPDPSVISGMGWAPSDSPSATPPQFAPDPGPTDAQLASGLSSNVYANVQNGSPQWAPPLTSNVAPPPVAQPQLPSISPLDQAMPVTSPSQMGAPASTVPVVTALPALPATPYTGGPITSPGDLNAGAPDARQSPGAFKAQVASDAKQQATQNAFAATPEGIAQKADAQNLAAIDKLRQGNVDADAVQASQNDAIAKATQASTDRQAKQEQIDAAQRAADQATTAKYSQQYAQQIKDAADYKVNTNRDVGMGGLIAVALSGIGDALDHRHGPNAALQIINDSIDKRIADQWAQKKALGDKATGTKDVLDVSRQDATSHRQDQDVQKAAMLVDANNQIANIKAQSANPALKARAETMQAGIEQQIAGITTGLAQRKLESQKAAQEEAYKKETLGVSYGQLALAQTAHADEQKQQTWSNAIEVAKLVASGQGAQAAALQKQHDDINERGIIMPDGIATAPDGTTQPKWAPIIQQDGTPYIAPKEEAKDIHERFRASTQGIDAIDKLRQLRSDGGGNAFNTADARAKLQEEARLIMKLHEAGGIKRLSGEAVEMFEKMATGGANVTSMAKDIMPALDTAREDMISDANSNLIGYTGPRLKFPDPVKAKTTTPLGEQLTQPFAGKEVAAAPEYVAPQTNAPSIINNFGRTPGSPTVIASPETWHERVVRMLHEPKN